MNTSTGRRICEITFFIRYAETDQMGIVHHSSYVIYAEELRMQYMRNIGLDYVQFEQSGLAFAVSGLQCRYLAPALFGQRLTVHGWITDLKSRRISFEYAMFNPDTQRTHVTATSDHVLVDRDGQVRRIPDFLIQAYSIENF